MSKIEYLQEFVTLAQVLNFRKAAELCYTTQPSLSAHIAALEEELGSKLFDRSTRSVALTSAGKLAMEGFQKVLVDYQNTVKSVQSVVHGKSGSLTISSPYYWTAEFTEPWVSRFAREVPMCDIRIISGEPPQAIRDVVQGKSDLAISLSFKNNIEGLKCTPYAYERLAAVVDVNHPLASRTSILVQELDGESLVQMEGYEIYYQSLVSRLSEMGVHFPKIIRSHQIETIAMTIHETGGVSILPYGARKMDRSYVKFLLLPDEAMTCQIGLYYREDNTNPMVRRYIQMLEKNEILKKWSLGNMRNPYEYITQLKKTHITEAKKAVQNACIHLAEGKDYSDISVKELCQKAHVSRSTFYAYYRNVADVLEEIENGIILDFLSLNAGMMEKENSKMEDLRFFEATISYLQECKAVLTCLLVTRPEYHFIENLKAAIKYHFWERKFEAGSQIDDLVLDIVASVAVSAYAYVLKNSYEPNVDKVLNGISNILALVDNEI